MSQAVKLSIVILIVLLFVSFGFAGLTLTQKLTAEKARVSLEQQISEYRGREKKYLTENRDLQDKLKTLQASKDEMEARLSSVDADIAALNEQITELTGERDDFQSKVETLREERDGLLVKIQERPKVSDEESQKKIEELQMALTDKEKALQKALADAEEMKRQATLKASVPMDSQDDSYWAQVLKEKARMEVDLNNIKDNLSNSSVELVEIKKQNTDMQLALSELENQREELQREIKHGKDLSDTLALELARANNDKKFFKDRIDKIGTENETLRGQIKKLTTTKIALEKSIVRLQEEKKNVEKRLMETENVIQSRIDEIWEIKDSLDKSFKPKAAATEGGEVELPPIVVSSGMNGVVNPSLDTNVGGPPGFDGNVVSVNENNNFVIVDIGETEGIQLGDSLNVYRGSQYIAGLEVIQVRRDISAADIKSKVAKIQVGDIVR